jgi:hypothetical protein
VHSERIRRIAGNDRLALQAGFWWGLAEGLFFFVVPDVYISFSALFSPRAGALAWLSSIAGSLTAIPVIYLLTASGIDYLGFLQSIPGISAAMIESVRSRLAAEGLPRTPLLVLGGVPLKVYAGVAFSLNFAMAGVLLWTIFARVVRIAPTFILATAARLLFRRHIDAHPTAWLTLLGLLWLLFYVLYLVGIPGLSAGS